MIGTAQSRSDVESPSHVRMSYIEALVQAQLEEMERDERVILMGEDISVYGGGELIQRFGANRIWSMPISEGSFTGAAIGAAINGLRPIVDLNIASFVYLASDQIINQASKLRYMTGGQISIPVVIRCCMLAMGSKAAQHADRPYPYFMNTPGLKIISPTGAADMKGLMKAAIRDDDPVLVFEDSRLWALKEDVPVDPDLIIPLGKATIKRQGSDVTLVAIAGAMRAAAEATEKLAEQGVSVELIDPLTLKPLDTETIIESVTKTGRLIIVENAHRVCNLGSEIIAVICEEAFDTLKQPVVRVSAPDTHVPFSPALEKDFYPTPEKIISAIRTLL